MMGMTMTAAVVVIMVVAVLLVGGVIVGMRLLGGRAVHDDHPTDDVRGSQNRK